MEGEFAIKLTVLLVCIAFTSRRGKSRGISPTPDPGEEARTYACLKNKEPHLLVLNLWSSFFPCLLSSTLVLILMLFSFRFAPSRLATLYSILFVFDFASILVLFSVLPTRLVELSSILILPLWLHARRLVLCPSSLTVCIHCRSSWFIIEFSQ